MSKLTHLNFNSKIMQVFLYYILVPFNIILINFKFNESGFSFFLMSGISLFCFFCYYFLLKEHGKNFLGKIKIGRYSVILSLILISLTIITMLLNKEYSSFSVFFNTSLLMPILLMPIIADDIVYMKNEKEIHDIRKTVNKKYNWSNDRIKKRSYSFKNSFLINNGFDPVMFYFFTCFYSISVYFIYEFKVNTLYFLILLSLFYIVVVNRKKIIQKIASVISFLLAVILSFVFINYHYNGLVNPYENKEGQTDTTYSKTRIGNDNGIGENMYQLLFRMEWKNKETKLLPSAFYNFYNENDGTWLLSGNLRGYEMLNNKENLIEILETDKINAIDFDFLKNIKQLNNLSYHEISKEKPEYKLIKEKEQSSVRIFGALNNNEKRPVSIPLPYNAKYIIGDNIDKNNFYQYISGSLSINGSTGMKDWNVFYDKYNEDQYVLKSPNNEDVIYPKIYEENIKKIIKEANVNVKDSNEEKVGKLVSYFHNNYLYTLNNKYKRTGAGRTLTQFLEDDRRGHCEYFGTALTFALRELGIPARYSVGYLVTENKKNEGEDMYWVRNKDAHAWTTYWNGQAWKTADATPSTVETTNEFEGYSAFDDKMEEFRYWLNNIEFNYYYILIILFFIVLPIIYLLYKKSGKKLNAIYYKDVKLKKFIKSIEKYQKQYPMREDELYMVWAERVSDKELLKIVESYYERYNS